jgi:hypothetical protein
LPSGKSIVRQRIAGAPFLARAPSCDASSPSIAAAFSSSSGSTELRIASTVQRVMFSPGPPLSLTSSTMELCGYRQLNVSTTPVMTVCCVPSNPSVE